MILGIDHLVIAVSDCDRAADEITARLGLEVSPGGRHPALGTANRLAWLGDTYLELVAVTDPRLAGRSWIGMPVMRRLDDGSGLATFALTSDDLPADVGRLRGAGSGIGLPVTGERLRSDGGIVRWRLALPGALGPDRPPFLIEHEMVGPEWRPAVRMARAMFRHPAAGRARLERLELAVADPNALADLYRSELGLDPVASTAGAIDVRVGSQLVRLAPAGWPRPGTGIRITTEDGSDREVDLLGIRFALAGRA